ERFHEHGGIDFIYVVFVDHPAIQSSQRQGDFFRQLRPTIVEEPREKQSQESGAYGDTGKNEFRGVSGLGFSAFGGLLRRRALARSDLLRTRAWNGAMEYRSQKLIETIAAAKRSGNADVSAKHRKERENHQRNQHDLWTLVNAAVPMSVRAMSIMAMAVMTVTGFSLSTILAEERHEPQSEHVERSDEGGDHADQPINPICLVGAPQDFVFAEEARQARN